MPKIIANGKTAEQFVQPYVDQVLNGTPAGRAFENMLEAMVVEWLRARINRDFRLPPYFHRPNTNRNTRRRMILAEKRRGETRRAGNA